MIDCIGCELAHVTAFHDPTKIVLEKGLTLTVIGHLKGLKDANIKRP